jgi:hypothetical protein
MLKFHESTSKTIEIMDLIVTQMCDFQENVILRELNLKRANWSKISFSFCDVLVRHIKNIRIYEAFAEDFETHLKSLNSLFENERVCALLNILDKKVCFTFLFVY